MLAASEQFCRLVNYSLSELKQQSVATVLLFSKDLATFWQADGSRCQDARLIDRGGQVRHVHVIGLPNMVGTDGAQQDEQPSQVLWVCGMVASTSETIGRNSRPVDLSQAIYAIHQPSSAAEIVQTTSDWCQVLLSHYVGIGTYGLQDGWSWAYRSQELNKAIADGLGSLHNDKLLNSLQHGWRVRLQANAALADPALADLATLPSGLSSNGNIPTTAHAPNDHEVVLRLPLALLDQTSVEQTSVEPTSAQFEVLLVPIEYQGKVLGALMLSPSLERSDRSVGEANAVPPTAMSPAALTQIEIELATTLAKHAALAIAKATRHEAAQEPDQKLVQWVQHKIDHLQQALNFEAVIKRITEKIRDSLDERSIFETVMRELCEALVLDCCTVGFYDCNQQTVTVRYGYTTTETISPAQKEEPVYLTSSDSEIYGLLLDGLCIQLSPLNNVSDNASDRRTVAHSTTLAYPLMDNQQVIGDLWLYRPKYSLFTEQELQLVGQIASQCAVGLHQARLYQQARAQVKSLETMGDLKDDFLNTVSHELRTPVTNIKMTAKMLDVALSTQQITDTRIARYIKILHAEAQREMELINDLLDLQRLDAGMQALDLKYIDVTPWLAQVFDSFRERAVENQQQLHINVVTKITHIASDESSLKRIIAELINNACKYTPPHESITVEGNIGFDGMTLSVCNSGIEISKADHERIFEKFYRIKSSDRRKRGGTGLGLALVKQLAQHLGGDIYLTSGDGLTCFTLRLPLLELPDPESTP